MEKIIRLFQHQKKLVTQKLKIIYFLLVFVSSSSLYAQFGCNYLDGFVPSTLTPVKEVNVVVWRIHPSSGQGPWASVTYTDVQWAVENVCSNTFSTVPLPTNPLSPTPAPYIPDSRIKFKLKNYFEFPDDTYFDDHMGAAAYYNDPNAINVFLTEDLTGFQIGTNPPTGSGPKDHVYMFSYTLDNIIYHAGELAHEMGHMLGLPHTTDVAQIAFPSCNSCSFSYANDYEVIPYTSYPCTPGYPNNIMQAYSSPFCQYYLSPLQMAVMHYNLMTARPYWMTTTSYAAATAANSVFDFTVSSSQTWTTPRFYQGNITIPSGVALNIQCQVGMQNGGKVIVKKGGKLVVDGGTITNISGRTWDGIFVEGDHTLSEAISSGMPVYQGMAQFINGAVISHAQRGVRNYGVSISNYGGIVQAGNSSFLNNYMDVDLKGVTASSSISATICKFYSCNFKTNYYVGDNLFPFIHVNLDHFSGTWFHGCNFENDAVWSPYYYGGYGIQSVNSIFDVDQNGGTASSFIGLDRGIFVNNTNPIYAATISNSHFVNNISYGAYFMNVNYLSFKNNTVQNPGLITAYDGVYLNTCKYYIIRNNTFLGEAGSGQISPGLEIQNSGTGLHQVYRNSFSNLTIGINAMGDNSGASNILDGLKMNCNDFTQTSNGYDIALDLGLSSLAPSVMTDQGAINGFNSTNLVRNMYAATCGNQNQWYVHSSSSKIINHGANSQSFTRPEPQPSCSRTIVSVVNSSISLTYSLHCGLNPPSSGGTSTNSSISLANMNDYITTLKGLTDQGDDGNVVNHAEIQATTASKLNLFLTDTVNQSVDSVLALIENNQGAMEDADLQTVFAYMAKGDYSTAQDKVNNLNESRADWATLLTKLITLENTDGLSSLNDNDTDRNFFLDYATTDNKDGQSLAQAILKYACDSSYTEPHNYPEGSGFRKSYQQEPKNTETALSLDQPAIKVYPNPAQTGITVYYNAKTESPVKIELRDLVGRLIYTNFINAEINSQYIDMREFNSGMYLITLYRNKEVIYKTKIIRQD